MTVLFKLHIHEFLSIQQTLESGEKQVIDIAVESFNWPLAHTANGNYFRLIEIDWYYLTFILFELFHMKICIYHIIDVC